MSDPILRRDGSLMTEGVLASPPTRLWPAPGPRVAALARAARRAAGALTLVAICGTSLETAARVEDWVRYRTPFWSPFTSETDLIVRDAEGMHGRPGARYRKWSMNALGLRGPEIPLVKRLGTVRVVTAGASETFGLYESPGNEFPRQLEDTLNARLAAGACGNRAPRAFEVLNAALPGMSLPTVAQDLRLRLARYGVDVVLYYPSPVQYLEDEPPYPAPPDSSPRAGALPMTRALHPRALERFRDEAKRLTPAPLATYLRRRVAATEANEHPADWRYEHLPPDRLALYERDLRTLIGTVRAIGASPAVATHADVFMRDARDQRSLLPAWERFYPRATGRTLIAFDSAARLATIRAARDSAAPVADVAGSVTAAPGELFADFVHFTDRGAAIAAGEMAGAVLDATRQRGACGPTGAR